MTRLKSLTVENFVAFHQRLEWRDHASLNVIIGANDTCKTHLLSSKLRWTFLPRKMELGRLVTRGSGNRLSADLRWNSDGRLKFGFGRDTTVRITEIETNEMGQLAGHKATFLPTKEILSIFDAIVATRESQEIASFDDTYYDLVQDFRQPTVGGNWKEHIKRVFRHLEDVTGGGEVEMQSDGSIMFRRGKESFNMHQTAEGIKKIGILSRLMRNRRNYSSGPRLAAASSHRASH